MNPKVFDIEKLAGSDKALVDGVLRHFELKGIPIAVVPCPKVKVESALNYFPDVGYLCMSFDPIDRMNAVFDFQQQDWPNDKKTLYLLHQRDSWGDFPNPTFNNCGLDIVDVNCEGYPWPEMWTFKFKQYLEACTKKYTVWWDEDDRYPANYTRLAMEPILKGYARMAWSWDMIVTEYSIPNARFEYRDDWYRSPVATMAIETDLLREWGEKVCKLLYEGDYTSGRPKRIRGIPYGGAQDDQLRQMLQHNVKDIQHHRAKKLYFLPAEANSAQLRAKGNALNYRGKRGSEDEKKAQPTRFDYQREY